MRIVLKPLLSFLRMTSLLSLGWLTLIVASPMAFAQNFSKSFTVAPDASQLEVINQTGSIKITAVSGSANKIIVNARQSNGDPKINATQTAQGVVKVEVTGKGAVDFDITVPLATNLDLLSYKGMIVVSNVSGPVRARITTQGNIIFNGLRSPIVEANSAHGDVTFSGDILPSGTYTFKSFSGRVDATLPANADFKLLATSYRSKLELGGFPVKFDKKTEQLVEGQCGQGRANLNLWTQDGSINLHRKL